MGRVLRNLATAVLVGAAKGTGFDAEAAKAAKAAPAVEAPKAPKAKAAKAAKAKAPKAKAAKAASVPSSEGSATVLDKPKASKGIKGFPIYPYFDFALAEAGKPLTEDEFNTLVGPVLRAKDAAYDVASRVGLYFRDASNRVLGNPSSTPRKPRGRTGGTVYGPTRPDGNVTLVYDPKATVVKAPVLVGAVEAPKAKAKAAKPAVEAPKPIDAARNRAIAKAAFAKAAKAEAVLDLTAEVAKAEAALRRDGAERDARKAAKAKAD